MSDNLEARRSNTEMYRDFFNMAFEMTDVMSVWWQPVLKGVGRAHLEFATLQSKTMQAAMSWNRAVASARQPDDLLRANYSFYTTVLNHCEDAAPRVTGAINTATEPVVGFQLLAMPARPRRRDELVIDSEPGRTSAEAPVRKRVA